MNSQGSKKSRIYPHTKRIFNTSYPNLKKTHDIRYGVGVYLDYAATTPVDSEVLKAMAPYFSEKFGNTSSVHSYGQEVIAAMDKARESIAKFLNCDWNEIIFTGSATEANNLAIFGIARNFQFSNSNFQINSKFLPSGDLPKGDKIQNSKFIPAHIITTNIEHESVHEPLRQLAKSGNEVTYVKCDKEGLVSVSSIEKAVKDNTILVSVIYANNEIGVIQPIKEIGRLIEKINERRRANKLGKIYFHTDATQAVNYLEVRPDWLKADLLTFSGHKIYGPKGIGGLYVRKNTPLEPIIFGGGQEFGLRSGTENVASIVGLARAIEIVGKNKDRESRKITRLRDKLLDAIIKLNKNIKLNGSLEHRLPNNLNLRFSGYDNETLLVAFDQAGLAVSAGSACSARSVKVSHVLVAIGLSEKEARESVRITLGRYTTEADINKVVEIIKKVLRGNFQF